MKNILVIGPAPQNFFNPIAKELKKKGCKIDIIYYSSMSGIVAQDKLYDRKFYIPALSFITFLKFTVKNITKFRSIYNWLNRKKVYKRIHEYDVINFHQIDIDKSIFKSINKNQKVILSFWGSDILRANENLISNQKKWINRANLITLHHKEMEESLLKNHSNITAPIRRMLFPINTDIHKFISQKNKTVYDKVRIAIGYNGNKAFKHLKVIEELKQLPTDYLGAIEIVILANYGMHSDYLNKIKNSLKGLNYKIIADKVTLEELAQRRVDTDIMIQVSSTDAFSASVSEVLMAKNYLIVGDWLPYSKYEENGVFYTKVNNLDGITKHVKNFMDNRALVRTKLENNPERVLRTLDYDGNLKKWVEAILN